MKKILSLILTITLFSIVLTSCKKDDESNNDLLTNTPWVGISMKAYEDDELKESINLNNGDVTITFNTDKTFTSTILNTSENKHHTHEGTWLFTSDETALEMTHNHDEFDSTNLYSIDMLTKSTLILSSTNVGVDEHIIKVVTSYVH